MCGRTPAISPPSRVDPEAFFGLLYHEILIREELGERPDPGDYARAFPEFAERLRLQMEVHEALSADDLAGAEADGRRRTASRARTARPRSSRVMSCLTRSVAAAWGSSTVHDSSSPAGWSR